MIEPISLTIDDSLYRQLYNHLFPDDGDEHGAVIAAGVTTSPRGTRLLAREIFLARDGADYVPGTYGYRALTTRFVAEKAGYCADQKLAYLAVHCHGLGSAVKFSPTDLASHERGYRALLDITEGGPVGGLVFASNAVAGDIWTSSGRYQLSHMTIVGPRIRRFLPAPQIQQGQIDPIYDRHARLFGDVGQQVLGGLKVGIIGLGGGGSLLNEWLTRLGVGHIVAVDFDRVDLTNLPRIVGATRRDAGELPFASRWLWLRHLSNRIARYKVHVAQRVAKQANPSIRYEPIIGSVLDEAVARHLTDVDFLFLASDSIQSRLVFNALVHQYLIPGAQVGAKVSVNQKTHQISDIFAATRLVLPSPEYGCLDCHGLIPPARLQQEAMTPAERRAQQYVDDESVAEPSVITLNVLSTAQAANDLMMMFTGLYSDNISLDHLMTFARERTVDHVLPHPDPSCPDCSLDPRSRRARGDRARLPCRPHLV